MNQKPLNPYASPQQAESSSMTGSLANLVWSYIFAFYLAAHLAQIALSSIVMQFEGTIDILSRPLAGSVLISLVAPVFFFAVGVAFVIVAAVYGMRRLFLLGLFDLSATFMNFLLLLPLLVG